MNLNQKEKELLSRLENRLINVNKRNRMLYSGKINKNFGIDIFRLFNNNIQLIKDLEKALLTQSDKRIKVSGLMDGDEELYSWAKKIIRVTEKNRVETGNNELYIGYPFLQGRAENENFNFKAPLALFPVTMQKEGNGVIIFNDPSRNILYNTTLILANNKFNKKNKILPDGKIDDEDFTEETFIPQLIQFYKDNDLEILRASEDIEHFFENTYDEFPKYKHGEIELKKYMVLGLFSSYLTTMYRDIHEMIENENTTKLVKELLWGFEKSSEDDDNEPDYNEIEQPEELYDEANLEKNINYINELDFAQEKVLSAINTSEAVVIQGPPGTGKSQTITSIIAQAVLDNKKVLMVSEKKTALDVIYSRLGELSDFVLFIDDVENKQEFYTKLNNIISKMNLTIQNKEIEHENVVTSCISEINTNLEKLNEIGKSIYTTNDFGTSIYTLYKNCNRYDFSDSTVKEKYEFLKTYCLKNKLLQQMKFEEIELLVEKLKKIEFLNNIELYSELLNSSEALSYIRDNLSDAEIGNFKNILNDIDNKLVEITNETEFLKRLPLKIKVRKLIKNLLSMYFTKKTNSYVARKFILNNPKQTKEYIDKYSEYCAAKFLYDKLSNKEKAFLKFTTIVKHKFDMPFIDALMDIRNVIFYEKIMDFEKSNATVLNYISNFNLLIDAIRENVKKKKDLTKKLAYINLVKSSRELNINNQLFKIQELCNRKRKMAINKFMLKYKDELLSSIKVWLMTPEAVSDMLPFAADLFDIVVFDEASQIYLEKAIPAIYRAKKVVVAGDQKQLKPSSLGVGRIMEEFDDEEDDDIILEYESLLDAARYKYRHTMLNYHYRSAKEELIAFSNYAFYDGKLIVTTKAVTDDEVPIQRIFVEDGRYIDKKNLKEAEAVLNLIKDIFKNRKENETVGVITFNSSQMELIEDVIEKEREKNPEFDLIMQTEENRIQDGENKGFFVKNIETVQGDERDIIIFCVGYAKNEHDRVSINFGWLNQDGGENRLNVAISRSKKKVYVITSIEPEELLVDNTKNDGPKLFREYLEYAKAVSEKNEQMIHSILLELSDMKENGKEQNVFESPFEEEVYNKLSERGYVLETQYGVGGYRIDMIVKSKDGERNLLGIECDGRLYHSSEYARERDYHRQKYLEARGWNVYRIWSSNWWKNPNLEIEKLDKYLQSLDEAK